MTKHRFHSASDYSFIPLSPGFLYSCHPAFHHGEETYQGYRLLNEKYVEEHKLNEIKDAKGQPLYTEGKIYAVDANGMPDLAVSVYDFSLTRNAVQMLLSLIFLIWMMMAIAEKYEKGEGTTTAPTGIQNVMEPVITFIRDEVARPNLGNRYTRNTCPYLLTVFFFILINNLIGLIPGTANVTGNIAFTFILGIISFIVILFQYNKHFWAHIFNPPVPVGVKPILVPVEIMGVFTKPFALIIRLFANMMAGHIIVLCLISLIFIFGAMKRHCGWGFAPFSLVFAVFIYFIEILVASYRHSFLQISLRYLLGYHLKEGHDNAEHHEALTTAH